MAPHRGRAARWTAASRGLVVVTVAAVACAQACVGLSGLAGGDDLAEDVTDGGHDGGPDASALDAGNDSCAPFEGVCGGNAALRVSAGYALGCALLEAGVVYCWGNNDVGQVGASPSPGGARLAPMRVPGLDHVVAVEASRSFACALRDDGSVWCWGSNSRGQLGHVPGTEADVTCNIGTPISAACNGNPTPVKGLVAAVAVTVGDAFACALTRNGQVACWGDDTSKQLGLSGAANSGDAGLSAMPVVAADDVSIDAQPGKTLLCAGYAFACVLGATGGRVKCWGDNAYGQLGGVAKGGSSATPTYVLTSPEAGAPELADADTLTCATLGAYASSAKRGVVEWWPQLLEPNTSGYVEINAGDSQLCARTAGGDISCWGQNTSGELGIPDAAVGFGAAAAFAPGTIVFHGPDVSAGYGYTLAVGPDGGVWGWGGGSAAALPFDGGASRTPRRLEGLP